MIARYMSMTSVASELHEGSPIVWKSEWQGRSFARSSLHPVLPIRQRMTIELFDEGTGHADRAYSGQQQVEAGALGGRLAAHARQPECTVGGHSGMLRRLLRASVARVSRSFRRCRPAP